MATYDPNLDDEELIQSIAENQEAIARGDSCDFCGAEWINHQLIHTPDCLYLVVGNMLEARSLIEDLWGGEVA